MKKRAAVSSMTAMIIMSMMIGVPLSSANDTPSHHDTNLIKNLGADVEKTEPWSDERLLAAEPTELEQIEPTLPEEETTHPSMRATDPRDPIVFANSVPALEPFANVVGNRVTMASTVVKIFSKNSAGEDKVCSGSVVNSNGKNLVYTAAHCVYDNTAEGLKGEHTDIWIVPAYYEVVAGGFAIPVQPFGQWYVSGSSVFSGWTDDADRRFDQAFLTVEPSPTSGKNIVEVVGGNGLSYNNRRYGIVDVLGYPVDGSFADPRQLNRCSNMMMTDSDAVVPGGSRVGCYGMTGGSSGGPWFSRMDDLNRGEVIMVTSGRPATKPGDPYNQFDFIHGAPNTVDTKTLYEHRDGI